MIVDKSHMHRLLWGRHGLLGVHTQSCVISQHESPENVFNSLIDVHANCVLWEVSAQGYLMKR